MQDLLPILSTMGVRISYQTDGQLTECRNPTCSELVGILMYAVDICLIADDPDNLGKAIVAVNAAFLRYGLTVSTQKSKVLVVGKDAQMPAGRLHILVST